jgi:hypothetical protein
MITIDFDQYFFHCRFFFVYSFLVCQQKCKKEFLHYVLVNKNTEMTKIIIKIIKTTTTKNCKLKKLKVNSDHD